MRTKSLSNWLQYLIILVILSIVVLLGYWSFTYFVTSVAGNFASFNLFLVAVIAGVAVFFSPCSFPFIPVYLTKYYTLQEKSGKGSPFMMGIFASLGLLTFNLLLGLVIAVIGVGFGKSLSITGQDPNNIVRILRGVVGFFLLYVGYSHLSGKGLNLHFLSPKVALKRTENPFTGIYKYGFLYTLIGIGCAGPILAGLSVFAFSTGGFNSAILAFAVYSLVMVALMIFISLLASLSKETLIEQLKTNTLKIKKITGIVIVLVGLFLIWSSIFLGSFISALFP